MVLTLSGYAVVDRHLPFLRLGAMTAEGLVMGQGGSIAGINLGRMSTIVKPLGIPESKAISHTPVGYVVGRNDTLSSIARRFGISVADILWSNPRLISTQEVSAGDRLALPPVPGTVVFVRKGDTVASIARRYHVSAKSIEDFNYLRTDRLTVGQALVVPGARGPAIPSPNTTAAKAYGGYSVRVGGSPGGWQNGQFPYGYCTWYVATRRHVTWTGDAYQWWPNARAAGRPEGQTPRVGAIMVTWESSVGHVAYVEQVNADGSWVVSEMNFVAWGVVDHRTIKPGQVPLIGFIY